MAVSSSVPTNLFLALSPSPSPSSLIPSSTWLPFLQTRTRRPTHFTSHRLVVSLSFHTLASPNEDYPETEPPFDTVNKKKKKKKPRPSFYDQTLERWSVRISSQRSKFPWQERQVEEKKDPILPSPHVVDGVPSKGIPVNSSSRNHGVSAPWVHGKNPRKPHLEYEADTQVPKREVKFDGVGKKSRVDLIIKKLNSPLYYNSSSLNVEIPIDGSDDEDGHNSDDTSLLSPRPVEESPPITKPVGIPLGRRLATAPWAHGAKPRRADSNCISETQIPQSSLDFGGENSRDDSNVGRLNISLDQNCSDSNEGTPFAIFNHEERHNSKENTLCQSLPVDGGPAAIKTLGNTLGDGVIVPRKPHLDSEAKTPIQLDSLDSNGEGEKSRVTFIVEKLKRSLDPSNPNLDAGISFGKSDGEEGPNSDGDIIMGSISFPWERYSADSDGEELPTKSNTELAERTIPEPELRRLRNVALRMKERMKVGPAGTTEAVVESIHEKWKEAEVVKLKFEGPPSLNMKRTHEVLERKTGGLVVWRSGSSLVLYRGMAYKLPCVQSYPKLAYADASHIVIPPSDDSTTGITGDMDKDFFRASKSSGADVMSSFGGPTEGVTDAFDIDSFLDELGPRFKDWSGCNPLPVDADLLPCVVPGYKPPYRLLPYKIRSVLRNREMTSFRRLARTMPPHFALGRNRQHQGLAKAMVKLWEKSAIAKIAIKRGVPNTCNERMAEEIKVEICNMLFIGRN